MCREDDADYLGGFSANLLAGLVCPEHSVCLGNHYWFDMLNAQSLESLMEGHNWLLNQFVEITWRSIIVCMLLISFGKKPV